MGFDGTNFRINSAGFVDFKMNRYFVSYTPFEKAAICIDGSPTVRDFIASLLNMEFWTEVTWIEYWLYRIFE